MPKVGVKKVFVERLCQGDCGNPVGYKGWTAIYCDDCALRIRRERQKIRNREVRKAQEYKDNYRSYIILKNYGITVEEYEGVFERQGRKCAICPAVEPGGSKGWHTDHDHETGQFRGILCHKCNLMIGLANDDPSILSSAISYLVQNFVH